VKIQILSDLHVEFYGTTSIPRRVEGTDLVIVAGDTCQGLVKAVEVLRRAFPDVEVVTVAGNHEYYRTELPTELEAGRVRAKQLGVHLLEDDSVKIGPVRVLGCTLWTDYCLFGANLREAAMRSASDGMMDHKRIHWRKDPWARFRPQEAALLHARSRLFLETALSEHHDGPTIAVAHHAVTLDAVAPQFQRSLLSAAYASELLPLVDRHQPAIFVTGHTHFSMNLRRGRTRLVSNPRGYPGENPSFDPAFTMEISDA
jgi:Icc-related predicted phosphoesterase